MPDPASTAFTSAALQVAVSLRDRATSYASNYSRSVRTELTGCLVGRRFGDDANDRLGIARPHQQPAIGPVEPQAVQTAGRRRSQNVSARRRARVRLSPRRASSCPCRSRTAATRRPAGRSCQAARRANRESRPSPRNCRARIRRADRSDHRFLRRQTPHSHCCIAATTLASPTALRVTAPRIVSARSAAMRLEAQLVTTGPGRCRSTWSRHKASVYSSPI